MMALVMPKHVLKCCIVSLKFLLKLLLNVSLPQQFCITLHCIKHLESLFARMKEPVYFYEEEGITSYIQL